MMSEEVAGPIAPVRTANDVAVEAKPWQAADQLRSNVAVVEDVT